MNCHKVKYENTNNTSKYMVYQTRVTNERVR